MLLSSLKTTRLHLKPFLESDVDLMQLRDQSAEVVRYLGDGKLRSREQSAKNLSKIVFDYQTYGLGLFAVYCIESGEFVGRSGLIPWIINDQLTWEIGYSFVESAWNLGYATECASHLKSWAIKNLEVSTLISLIHPKNRASIHVAEKIGMQFEKNHQIGDLELLLYRTV